VEELVQSRMERIRGKINYQCNGLCKSVTKSVWMSILTFGIPLMLYIIVWLVDFILF
jgi:hypothetical protein